MSKIKCADITFAKHQQVVGKAYIQSNQAMGREKSNNVRQKREKETKRKAQNYMELW